MIVDGRRAFKGQCLITPYARSQGKYEEAEPFSRRFLEIMEQIDGSHHSVAAKMNNLAAMMHEQVRSKGCFSWRGVPGVTPSQLHFVPRF